MTELEKQKVMEAYSKFIGAKMIELPEDMNLIIANEDDVLITFDLNYNTYICSVEGEAVYTHHLDSLDEFILDLENRDFDAIKEKVKEVAEACKSNSN